MNHWILWNQMDGYVMKYGGTGLSLLFNHTAKFVTGNAGIGIAGNGTCCQPVDFLDPLTTIIKLSLIAYKKIGTKIGINNHMIVIQEPSIIQGLQRYFNGNDRNQLYQLKWPLFYFHGIMLGHIEDNSHGHICQQNNFCKHLEEKAIVGLNRLKMTYGDTNETGSLASSCVDNYIQILTGKYVAEEYNRLTGDILTATVTSVYQECMKKWTTEDVHIVEQILQSIEKKNDKKMQSTLCDTIESFLLAKNREIALVRPC